jgi:hypothetical protein
MERMQIMGIWYQLSPTARRSLWESLGGMLGETPVVVSNETDASHNVDSAAGTGTRTRVRVWERDILRDVPLFAEFGQLTARQRRDDVRNVPRLLSIAQGVVARGRQLDMTDPAIRDAINQNIGDAEAMQALFGGPPDVEDNLNEQDSDEVIPMNDV